MLADHPLPGMLVASALYAFVALAAAAQPATLEPAFPNLTFSSPVDLQHPDDGSGLLFVVEQKGVIRVFENDPATTAAATFLDIQDRVVFSGEQGLLGLAFHPSYADNGFLYVDYVAPNPMRTVVARYQASTTNPRRAVAGSEQVLLEVNQPFANHNGGQIRFGPDGYLYVALGDGGSADDPNGNGQDRTTLRGALLRIDVDHPAAGRNYGIPPDNPFAGNDQGFREEIYAYGLRNPWRFSFDLPTGRLWLGDVGQNRFEEIDLIEKGANYGWDVMEGFHCHEPASGCDQQGLTLPIWEYDRSNGDRSITGGIVYRGQDVPALVGKYVYGDFISGRVWALTYDGSRVTENVEIGRLRENALAAFGTDAAGELYACSFDGALYRFAPTTDAGVDDEQPAAGAARLGNPFPNPFSSSTTITYTLDRPAEVEVTVYDVLGRRVRILDRGRRAGGTHRLEWNGSAVRSSFPASGMYLIRLRTDGRAVASRLVVQARS